MPRFLHTPNTYSPTYDIETDVNGNFVKLHNIWNIPPDYPEAKKITIEQHYIDYISGEDGKVICKEGGMHPNHKELIKGMTNWQNLKWIRAGRPLKELEKYAILER